jgi:Transcription factor WhiB/Homeodomain-like domain
VLSQTPVGERVRAELLADPGRTSREIAALAGCTRQTVHRMRHRLEAAGLIPERASRPPPAWRAPALPVMPPELADGLCTRHPEPDLWSSREPSDRAVALRVCRACPVQAICAAWSLALPVSDTAVWGGLTAWQRRAIRHRRQLAKAR